MSDAIDRVVPLDQLDDFEVAEGDPDIRGWKVLASDGRPIGEVDNLLVDTGAMKVRYLDIDLEDEVAGGEDRHILVPIGYARLDESDDHVFVDSLTSTELGSMPIYDHGPLTREYEKDLRGRFDHTVRGTSGTGSDFYAADLYDSDRFYSSRRGNRENPMA